MSDKPTNTSKRDAARRRVEIDRAFKRDNLEKTRDYFTHMGIPFFQSLRAHFLVSKKRLLNIEHSSIYITIDGNHPCLRKFVHFGQDDSEKSISCMFFLDKEDIDGTTRRLPYTFRASDGRLTRVYSPMMDAAMVQFWKSLKDNEDFLRRLALGD